jgi:hypothetical protein
MRKSSKEGPLPSLDAAARFVAPILGGVLFGSLYLPPGVGAVVGALFGLAVGLAHHRELAKSHE